MNVRLAYGGGSEINRKALEPFKQLPREARPGLLASYVYLQGFLKNLPLWGYRDWVLDSGAFSAHTCGIDISLGSYIDICKRLRDQDATLSEIFALDVIGDWKASVRNVEAMWKAGVEAIPAFHPGEPWDLLKGLARDYPKIAIGGVAKAHKKHKIAFAQQCFARVWPKPIHGFGFGEKGHILALPWHSVDATSWQLGPCAFARWNTYGLMSVRGPAQNLRVEVEFYLEIERQARERWKKELQVLDDQLKGQGVGMAKGTATATGATV